jgi:glycosyltransferase involved in cell wall biosynthesis
MVTVIIPSIGRSTLLHSLKSLINQSNLYWKCLVGFDGINSIEKIQFPLPKDPRIEYIFFPDKLGIDGQHGQAGKVRNNLIEMAKTDWVCFLDDDDTFKDAYIKTLYEEIRSSKSVVHMFRMTYNKDNSFVLPIEKKVKSSYVGISFAVNINFLKNNDIKFDNGQYEDFDLLVNIEKKGGEINWTDHILYNVRWQEKKEKKIWT